MATCLVIPNVGTHPEHPSLSATAQHSMVATLGDMHMVSAMDFICMVTALANIHMVSTPQAYLLGSAAHRHYVPTEWAKMRTRPQGLCMTFRVGPRGASSPVTHYLQRRCGCLSARSRRTRSCWSAQAMNDSSSSHLKAEAEHQVVTSHHSSWLGHVACTHVSASMSCTH
jgi:hypothetical protein